ncbi:MAG TPA: hypothetical protein VK066_04330 [Chloroflexota bacterium]|nr:hypothetical protein [Chloroflexota bacterium]
MAEHEREHKKEPASPLQSEGLKEYAAEIVPSTATEMEAVLEQLEAERDDFPPPDGREEQR